MQILETKAPARNRVAYPGYMTKKLDTYRDQLRALAAEQEAAKTIPARRTAIVDKARAEGMTWHEAATLLGMTQHGLIKASKAPRTPTTRAPRKTSPEPTTDPAE